MPKIEFNLSDEQLNKFQKKVAELIIIELKNQNLTQDFQRYLNKKEACKYLKISNNTLDSWISMGLPCIKINGTIRFDREAIDKFMQERV